MQVSTKHTAEFVLCKSFKSCELENSCFWM